MCIRDRHSSMHLHKENRYASLFKAHNGSPYASALSCVEEIVDKCAEIAYEVGTAKIGDPYNLYKAGNTEEALYACLLYTSHNR